MAVKQPVLEAKAVEAVSRCGYRDAEDTAYYPDPDVDLIARPPHARGKMTHKDGIPY